MTGCAIQVQPNLAASDPLEAVDIDITRCVRADVTVNLKAHWSIVIATLFVWSQSAHKLWRQCLLTTR